jgi:hypothetical protein
MKQHEYLKEPLCEKKFLKRFAIDKSLPDLKRLGNPVMFLTFYQALIYPLQNLCPCPSPRAVPVIFSRIFHLSYGRFPAAAVQNFQAVILLHARG